MHFLIFLSFLSLAVLFFTSRLLLIIAKKTYAKIKQNHIGNRWLCGTCNSITCSRNCTKHEDMDKTYLLSFLNQRELTKKWEKMYDLNKGIQLPSEIAQYQKHQERHICLVTNGEIFFFSHLLYMNVCPR